MADYILRHKRKFDRGQFTIQWEREDLGEEVEIQIIAVTPDGKKKIFYINLQKEKDISVGTVDRNFKISRIDRDGNPLIGDDNLVSNPHITFHPKNMLTHMTGNKGAPICQFLTFAEPDFGKLSSPWLRIRTPAIDGLRRAGTRPGKPILEWPVHVVDVEASVTLMIDWVKAPIIPYATEAQQNRYIKWGSVMLQLSMFASPGDGPSISLHTEG